RFSRDWSSDVCSSDLEEKSVELEKLRLLINKDLQKIDLKKVWSSEEKSVELLKKRTKVIIAILLLTTVPTTIEDLADTLEYKSKPRFREDYIKPLRDSKLIEYTLERANDPNQQYQITQRGINFLMGSVI